MTVMQQVRSADTPTRYVACMYGALQAPGWWDGDLSTLMGVSGLGFHVIADPTTCPSGPTSYDWEAVHTAAMRRAGVDSLTVTCTEASSFHARRDEAVRMIKDSLDRGIPAIVRSYEWQEFAVVTGYDDADGVLLLEDRPAQADPILYENLGHTHGYPMLFAQVPTAQVPFDLEDAFRDSLRYALTHWSAPASGHYRFGAEAYEVLVRAVERADSDALGLRYIVDILADAREHVAGYLTVVDGFGRAAELYAQAVPKLRRAAELVPRKAPWDAPLDRSVLPEAASLLRAAAALEQRAMDEIAAALA